MWSEYLLFFLKIFTVVVAILILLLGIVAITSKGKRTKEKLEIKKLNQKYEDTQRQLRQEMLDKAQLKKIARLEKKNKKLQQQQGGETKRKRIFVLNFHGDIRANAVRGLREEITGILTVATPQDEVVVRIESPGGLVHAYGLAASQLQRIRHSNIPLVAIVDKVAASGGYLMAAVANRIIAAPFAIIGSIGVIAQLPNFHQLLKKNNVAFEQIMAGQYKRTLTLFGENTAQGREKMQQEVNETQELFKSFVLEGRPSLDINEVATGEHWYGTKALELNLIDEIMTSDDYLLAASKHADIYEVTFAVKKKPLEKLMGGVQEKMAAFWNVI